MNKIYIILLIGFLLAGCKDRSAEKIATKEKVEFNQDLADELKRMAETDQIAAYIPQGEYKKMSSEQWSSFKDSVFTTHQVRLEQIFIEHGFPGYDLVGKEDSFNFWLMVQHSDHVPEFQKEVLDKMKAEVEKDNATPSDYGLLLDRVMLNTGEKQIYGTQVAYHMETCQAYAKNLADSLTVNERRESIGLGPIEEYLNKMTESHFRMNKEFYSNQGITEPKLYEIQ